MQMGSFFNAGSTAAKRLTAQAVRAITVQIREEGGRQTQKDLSAMARIHQDAEKPRNGMLREQVKNAKSPNLMLPSFLITVLLRGTF